jgi:hypothetical protein
MNTLGNFHQVQVAQQQVAQQDNARRQQEFQTWKSQQDALHAQQSKIPADQRQRYEKLAVEYMGSLGVSKADLHSLMRSLGD